MIQLNEYLINKKTKEIKKEGLLRYLDELNIKHEIIQHNLRSDIWDKYLLTDKTGNVCLYISYNIKDDLFFIATLTDDFLHIETELPVYYKSKKLTIKFSDFFNELDKAKWNPHMFKGTENNAHIIKDIFDSVL